MKRGRTQVKIPNNTENGGSEYSLKPRVHPEKAEAVEKLKPEYPTTQQINETWDAYLNGEEALMALISKRASELKAKKS